MGLFLKIWNTNLEFKQGEITTDFYGVVTKSADMPLFKSRRPLQGHNDYQGG